ncbi:integrase core domain-containing protein [Cupriavidus sp. 8B]
MDDARAKISAWRTHHNESRPHSALDWATPTEFARRRDLQVTSAILQGTGSAALASEAVTAR